MATVFQAEDLKHRRKVAIKVLNPELGATLNAERFLHEIQVTAGLHHPHILTLHDSGVCGDLLYYIMPFVDHGSLRERMPPGHRLPVSEAVRITAQIAGALDHAHRQGFIHRDIKPENVLLQDGEVLIADFGIARALQEVTNSERLTGTGFSLGTPAYMSPEQVAGLHDLDSRTDIFSLGCVLFEMLIGELPYTGRTAQAAMAKRILSPAPAVAEKRPDVPEYVATAVARALAAEREDRFERASDFAAALENPSAFSRPSTVAPSTADWRHRWLTRRRTTIALGAGVAALLAFGILSRREPIGSTSARLSPTAVAVFPFEIHGGAEVQYLREGIPDLLRTNLAGAGDIRSIDSRALFSAIRQRKAESVDLPMAKALARQFGAATLVTGSATAAGSVLRITARILAADSSDSAGEEIVVEGPSAALFGLVDSITTRLIGSRSRAPGERFVRIASRSTNSLRALKQYLVGASTFRRTQFDSAIAAFTTAAEIDTTFALAYYGLSLAAEHATQADLSRSSAEKAARFAERLSPHDQQLVNALVASRRGDAIAAERFYQEIIADFPEDVEAWFQLGEVRFHYGPPRGQPIAMAVIPFRQVLRYEPDNVGVLFHLARIAAGEGDVKLLDSLVSRVESLAPAGDRTLDMRALRAFAHEDTSAIRGILSEVSNAPDLYVPFVAWQVSAYLHDLNGAERVLRIGTHPDRPVEWRALAYSILAHIEAGRGKWTSSQAALDSLAVLDPLKALEHRALLTLEPFLKRPETELQALRDQLEQTSPPAPTGAASRSSLLTVDDQLHTCIRAYLLGSLRARLGDRNGANRSATELERITGDRDIQGIARDFARSVRAAAENNPRAALRQLEDMRLQTWYEFAMYSPFYSFANERFIRADLSDKLNQEGEALKWFSSFSHFSFFDVRYEAPGHLRQARILARQKKNALAASHYRAFLTMWQHADSQFQPEVLAARTELAGLSPPTSPH